MMKLSEVVILSFSSAGGLGYAPKAPGTFGPLAAIPIWWALSDLSVGLYVLVTAALIGFSVWVSDHADRIYGAHDSGKIVIDEVVGLLATAIAVPFNLTSVLVVFGLFRLFDILKPPPIRHLDEHVSGGFGVVIDDVIAGLMACPLAHLILYFLG